MSNLKSGSEKVNVSSVLEQLSELTSKMDVPVFRRKDVFWLMKHLETRNNNHPKFKEAKKLIELLSKMGVR